MQTSEIRGFNYAGSWGSTGYELWQYFDGDLMREEVARGKKYFPGWNMARWWLDHDAYRRDPARFLRNFEAGLTIFAEHDVLVMPVLFNRWHEPVCDFGGVYLDQLVPEYGLGPNLSRDATALARGDMANDRDLVWSLDRPEGSPQTLPGLYRDFMASLAQAHRDDSRIFAWHICNEPLSGKYVMDDNPVRQSEIEWLTWLADTMRALGVTQPLTAGNLQTPHHFTLQFTNSIVDLISIHPYYVEESYTPETYSDHVALAVEIAGKAGKPLIATECVWGSLDDEIRAENIRVTMGTLQEHGVGVIVHALDGVA